MNCRICRNKLTKSFATAFFLGQNVNYYDCFSCGYVQTEEPTWLDEAYASVMNISDTGIMTRNLSNVSLIFATLALIGDRKSAIVDYAGGYGFLVRLLRDSGIDAYWMDPFSENLVARGFEYQGDGKPSLVTAFEAFEHFVSPVEEMEKLLRIAPNILLTTNIIGTPAPKLNDWWYYGLDHGQHIGFYRVHTLQHLADKFGLQLLTDGISTHFFSKKKYSYRTWFLFRKAATIMPKLFQLGLPPKTWADHLAVSRSNQQIR